MKFLDLRAVEIAPRVPHKYYMYINNEFTPLSNAHDSLRAATQWRWAPSRIWGESRTPSEWPGPWWSRPNTPCWSESRVRADQPWEALSFLATLLRVDGDTSVEQITAWPPPHHWGVSCQLCFYCNILTATRKHNKSQVHRKLKPKADGNVIQ